MLMRAGAVSAGETDLVSAAPSARSAGYRQNHRDHPGPQNKGPTMSDKSPRQAMTKKSGKSLKEKRAAKHDKAARAASSAEALFDNKKR
jgi:hypothetical protein